MNTVIQEVRMGVGGMSCASCVTRVERAIMALPGVLAATANLSTESVSVDFLPDTIDRERIAQAIGEAGYLASPGATVLDEGRERQERELVALKRD